MIKKIITLLLFIVILSCSNIELVLKDSILSNPLANNVDIIVSGERKEIFTREIYSFFGENKNDGYILITSFSEKKQNLVVKKNQVAEKIDYELSVIYDLFYKNRECKILNKKVVTRFTVTPKSFGYNFGADRSLEKLYNSSVKKNIKKFSNSIPTSKDCL